MDSRDAKIYQNIEVFGKPNVLITTNPVFADYESDNTNAQILSHQSQFKDSTFSKLKDQLEKEHRERNINEYNLSVVKHSKHYQ